MQQEPNKSGENLLLCVALFYDPYSLSICRDNAGFKNVGVIFPLIKKLPSDQKNVTV